MSARVDALAVRLVVILVADLWCSVSVPCHNFKQSNKSTILSTCTACATPVLLCDIYKNYYSYPMPCWNIVDPTRSVVDDRFKPLVSPVFCLSHDFLSHEVELSSCHSCTRRWLMLKTAAMSRTQSSPCKQYFLFAVHGLYYSKNIGKCPLQ